VHIQVRDVIVQVQNVHEQTIENRFLFDLGQYVVRR
jgi:hypothetical protein